MNAFLLNRALGSVSHQALARAQNDRLLHSLQPAKKVSLSYKTADDDAHQAVGNTDEEIEDVRAAIAHPAGVNSIAIDRFEGRYLLSGGVDSSIAIWDLEAAIPDEQHAIRHKPLSYISKGASAHEFGITQVSFYPFDSLAFLSSSYDHTLKLQSSETLTASASFDLGSVVYSHATSSIASHLLVACATQHPAVRLVDLRSGASTHSLAGHGGAVLSVAWHPKTEHILASSATDGSVRVWDIRRSASSLGVLDVNDTTGVLSTVSQGPNKPSSSSSLAQRERAKAHTGPANGVVWTDGGDYLITTGHDERIRVWDMVTGANTLTNFGPSIKNSSSSTVLPLLTPTQLTGHGKGLLIHPNPRELLTFELHTGKLLSRLRTPSYSTAQTVGSTTSVRDPVNKTTSLAWRAHSVELYSAHVDGSIRCWKPRTWEDTVAEAEDEDRGEDDGDGGTVEGAEKKRKREELDEIVSGLTKKKVTFS